MLGGSFDDPNARSVGTLCSSGKAAGSLTQQDAEAGCFALSVAENQRGEVVTAPVTQALSRGGGKPGQGYPAVMVRDGGDFDALAIRTSQTGGNWRDPVHDVADTLDTAASSMQAVAFTAKDCGADAGEVAPTLRSGSHHRSHANGGVMPAIAFHHTQNPISSSSSFPCLSRNTDGMGVAEGMRVRRLTPRECERLQGFPDDWTLIPGAADGPRYRAIGNSMAVVVMRWLGERIDFVDRLIFREAA